MGWKLEKLVVQAGTTQCSTQISDCTPVEVAFFVLPGQEITLGRPLKSGATGSCDVVCDKDSSISKVHAKLQLGSEPTDPGAEPTAALTDVSRFGTFALGNKLQPNTPVALRDTDVFKLGSKTCFRLRHSPLVLLPATPCPDVPGLARQIGAQVVTEWAPHVTHVVQEPGTRLTPATVAAVAAGIPVVTSAWLGAVAARKMHVLQELPNPADFQPDTLHLPPQQRSATSLPFTALQRGLKSHPRLLQGLQFGLDARVKDPALHACISLLGGSITAGHGSPGSFLVVPNSSTGTSPAGQLSVDELLASIVSQDRSALDQRLQGQPKGAAEAIDLTEDVTEEAEEPGSALGGPVPSPCPTPNAGPANARAGTRKSPCKASHIPAILPLSKPTPASSSVGGTSPRESRRHTTAAAEGAAGTPAMSGAGTAFSEAQGRARGGGEGGALRSGAARAEEGGRCGRGGSARPAASVTTDAAFSEVQDGARGARGGGGREEGEEKYGGGGYDGGDDMGESGGGRRGERGEGGGLQGGARADEHADGSTRKRKQRAAEGEDAGVNGGHDERVADSAGPSYTHEDAAIAAASPPKSKRARTAPQQQQQQQEDGNGSAEERELDDVFGAPPAATPIDVASMFRQKEAQEQPQEAPGTISYQSQQQRQQQQQQQQEDAAATQTQGQGRQSRQKQQQPRTKKGKATAEAEEADRALEAAPSTQHPRAGTSTAAGSDAGQDEGPPPPPTCVRVPLVVKSVDWEGGAHDANGDADGTGGPNFKRFRKVGVNGCMPEYTMFERPAFSLVRVDAFKPTEQSNAFLKGEVSRKAALKRAEELFVTNVKPQKNVRGRL